MGGDTNEVGAGLRVERALIGQAQISLMNQSSGLQRVTLSLAAQTPVSHGAKFPVNERDQLLESSLVTAPPLREQ